MARIRNKPMEIWRARPDNGTPMDYIYCVAESGFTKACKVGVAGNLSARLSCLQSGNWRPLAMAWAIAVPDRYIALMIEAHCLSKFRPQIYGDAGPRKKLKSEWINAEPLEVLGWSKHILSIIYDDITRSYP